MNTENAQKEPKQRQRTTGSARRRTWLSLFSWTTVTLSFCGFFGLWHVMAAEVTKPASAAVNPQTTVTPPQQNTFRHHHHRDEGQTPTPGITSDGGGQVVIGSSTPQFTTSAS